MDGRRKALYVQYEVKIRGKKATKTITREWNNWSREQQDRWVAAFRRIRDLEEEVTVKRRLADEAARLADEIVEEANQDANNLVTEDRNLQTLVKLVDSAVTARNQLRSTQERLLQAWQNLTRAEQDEEQQRTKGPPPNQRSLNFSTNMATSVRNDVNNSNTESKRLNSTKNKPPVPVDGQGKRKVLDYWVPNPRRQARLRKKYLADRNAQRIGLSGEYNQRWEAQRDFSGALSNGWLWLKFDENERIMDRVFRKDAHLQGHKWLLPTHFDGDVKDNLTRVPWEISCLKTLTDLQNEDKITEGFVRLRNYAVIDDDEMYRTYQEWSEHRDLYTLIINHAGPPVRPIPEPVIWMIAEALIYCGVAMDRGSTRAEGERDVDWRFMVHRDLKPQNVFLDKPDSTEWPFYARPRLGDFGLAFRSDDVDWMNPRYYNWGSGTMGYLAPEQRKYVDQDTLQPINEWPMNEKTNIYGFALILWSLITLRSPPQPLWLGEANDHNLLDLDRQDEEQMDYYSSDLKEFIQGCLQFDPSHRPTFEQMLAEIGRQTDESETGANRSRGMRSGQLTPERRVEYEMLFSKNNYKLGFSRQEVSAQENPEQRN